MKHPRVPEKPDHGGLTASGCETETPRGFLLALLLFSLACRLILIQFKDVVGTDELIYLSLGKNLWQGLGFQILDRPMTMVPPLLPIVSGFFSLFTDDLERGTNFTYVVFGGGTVIPYFYLARRIYGTRVARRASFFLAFFPGLLLSFYWGSMTEPLYTFLFVTALLCFHKGLRDNKPADFALAGVLLSLVYLTRSEGLLSFIVLFLFAILYFSGKHSLFEKKTLRNLLLMGLSAILVSAPYPLFLKETSGQLSISGKTKLILLVGAMDLEERESLAGRLNVDGTEFFDYEGLVRNETVLGMIMKNPKALVGGSLLQIQSFFVTLLSWKVFPVFLIGFVLLGLFRDPWDRARLEDEAFLLTACLPFLVFLTFKIWPRYLLPMTPILLLWATRGVTSLEDWIRQSSARIRQKEAAPARWLSVLPVLLFALPLLAILVAKPIKARMLVQYPVEYREAGKWLDEHLPKDAMILTRKPEVAYYARRRMHPLPNEELPFIVRYARLHGIDYLVVDEFFIPSRPQLAYLLEEDTFPEEILFLHQVEGPNGRKVRIFKVKEDLSEFPPPVRP